jgi:hypothetical protein
MHSGVMATPKQTRRGDFYKLAERFRSSKDRNEVKKLGEELGRFVFGGKMPECTKYLSGKRQSY